MPYSWCLFGSEKVVDGIVAECKERIDVIQRPDRMHQSNASSDQSSDAASRILRPGGVGSKSSQRGRRSSRWSRLRSGPAKSVGLISVVGEKTLLAALVYRPGQEGRSSGPKGFHFFAEPIRVRFVIEQVRQGVPCGTELLKRPPTNTNDHRCFG